MSGAAAPARSRADVSPALGCLLLCLSGNSDDAQDLANLEQAVRSIAPRKLASLAVVHRVVPWLAHRLARLPDGKAVNRLDALLQPHVRANALRAMVNTREQWLLGQALLAEGVKALPLKGVGLAQVLYGDVALRQHGDIDLLVEAADVPVAYRVMRRLGFEDVTGYANLPATAQAWVRRHHKDIEWVRRDPPPLVVDLHWRLSRQRGLLDLPLADIWARGHDLAIGPCTQRMPSPEDLLLCLCVHGSATAWYRCKWLADLPPLIGQHGLDWTVIGQRAAATGSARAVAVGLAVARDLLGVSLPEGARALAAKASPADLRFVVEALHSPDDWWPGSSNAGKPWGFQRRYWAYQLRLGTGWRYRWDYLASRCISLDDLRATRMPRAPLWAYAVIRPFSWAFRRMQKTRRP